MKNKIFLKIVFLLAFKTLTYTNIGHKNYPTLVHYIFTKIYTNLGVKMLVLICGGSYFGDPNFRR